MLAQVEPHNICPQPQLHLPLLQIAFSGQALSHAPQWACDRSRSMHWFPHCFLPMSQLQLPLTHRSGGIHSRLQIPQCKLLRLMSTHSFPHFFSPAWQPRTGGGDFLVSNDVMYSGVVQIFCAHQFEKQSSCEPHLSPKFLRQSQPTMASNKNTKK